MTKTVGFYDAYDDIELRLPNRRRVICRSLTVATAARCLRLVDAEEYVAMLRVLLRAILPRRRRWIARWRTGRVLTRLRGKELSSIVDRFLLLPAMSAERDRSTQGSVASSPSGDAVASSTRMDDMIADYAAVYGGPPPADLPWPLFMACVRRVDRMEARRLFHAMAGTAYGAGSIFADRKTRPSLDRSLADVKRAAYG